MNEPAQPSEKASISLVKVFYLPELRLAIRSLPSETETAPPPPKHSYQTHAGDLARVALEAK